VTWSTTTESKGMVPSYAGAGRRWEVPMSFRELTMIDVKEVLRRWQAGQSGRQMAREGVVGRRTVARYIEAAKELGVTHDAELTDELVRAVAGRVQERPAPDPSDIRRMLDQ
jgi:hypothetical protein